MLKRRARRSHEAEQQLLEDTFESTFGRPSQRHIKGWYDQELHARLASNSLLPDEKSMAQRELDRRKAWESPAGRAFWISCAALAVSLVALCLSAWATLAAKPLLAQPSPHIASTSAAP
jgi:hypothetical protein